MPPPLSPLANTVASLRVATLARPAHAWVPAAIHALILACLARLFGRLEEMVRLWQAGLLPPPTHRARTVQNRTPTSNRDSGSAPRRRAPRPVSDEKTHMETERQRELATPLPSLCLSVSMCKCLLPAPGQESDRPTTTASRAERRHPSPTPPIRRRIGRLSAALKHGRFVT